MWVTVSRGLGEGDPASSTTGGANPWLQGTPGWRLPAVLAGSAPGAEAPAPGDKLLLVPGHCDPTVNLYDRYVCVRGGLVEALWPITARGA